jgi:hypothetical protein
MEGGNPGYGSVGWKNAGLKAGMHKLRVEFCRLNTLEASYPGFMELYWEGPDLPLARVPAGALHHLSGTSSAAGGQAN